GPAGSAAVGLLQPDDAGESLKLQSRKSQVEEDIGHHDHTAKICWNDRGDRCGNFNGWSPTRIGSRIDIGARNSGEPDVYHRRRPASESARLRRDADHGRRSVGLANGPRELASSFETR